MTLENVTSAVSRPEQAKLQRKTAHRSRYRSLSFPTLYIGDVVALKSGGPIMTITKIEGARALCDWFNAKSERQTRALAKSKAVP